MFVICKGHSYCTHRTLEFMRENVHTDMRAMFLPVYIVKLGNSLNSPLILYLEDKHESVGNSVYF